jgi:hypothetical protein
MRVFIGSARESLEAMDWLAACLEEFGHEPVRWDSPGLFPPGENAFEALIVQSKTVDAAIFIFGEDDKVWYRGDSAYQPRDNVLIEYGAFAGRLGMRRSIICVNGKPKGSSDLAGITYVDISEERRQRARLAIKVWANKLASNPVDPATLQLLAKVAEGEQALELVETRLQFAAETIGKLQEILTQKGVIDFDEYNLEEDGHWKLLFDFDYYWPVSLEISRTFSTPEALREELSAHSTSYIVEQISWAGFEKDRLKTPFLVRKALRLLRDKWGARVYTQFVRNTAVSLRSTIESIAEDIIARRSIGKPGARA